ncbi:MAG: CRISPR-associated endonuclease Cas3'' [Thermoprotei archaeon]|nr:CRISPR-associated endonuclease Cas3'' [Thermoprotei archaeon]
MSVEWPLAYVNVDLADHLVKTTLLARCLFDNDIKAAARRANIDREVLDKILTISALLHDLGKASRYYLDRWRTKGELTFPYHEIISALFLFQASREARNEPMKACTFMTAAKIVSRHHVAMRGRHPRDYSVGDKRMKDLSRIVDGLDANDVISVLDKLLSQPATKIVDQELKFLKSNAQQLLHNLKLNMPQKISSLADLRKNPGYACGNMNELIVVRVCTGFLIVADNIVASYEGRDAEDYPTRVHVENWKKELKNINNCRINYDTIDLI